MTELSLLIAELLSPEILYPALIVLLAYTVRGITGFGSALVAVPLLSLSLPLPLVVPIIVLMDYLGSLTQGISQRQHVHWKEIWPLIPFSLLGISVSLYLLDTLDKQVLALGLGGFIIAFAIYQLIPFQWGQTSQWLAAPPGGFLGGFVGTLFGTGGPFFVIYLRLRHLDKTAFRSTIASIFLIDGGFRLAGYVLRGSYDDQGFRLLALWIPTAAVGMYLGGKLHGLISQNNFIRFISVLLVFSGSLLIWKNA